MNKYKVTVTFPPTGIDQSFLVLWPYFETEVEIEETIFNMCGTSSFPYINYYQNLATLLKEAWYKLIKTEKYKDIRLEDCLLTKYKLID